MMTLPLSIIALHWFADFIMQDNDMALNKGKNTLKGLGWLSLHVAVYTGFMSLYPFSSWQVLSIFVMHWITDFITSRITTKLWFFKPYGESNMWHYSGGSRHWFFVMIGLDQLIHYGCLAWTLKYLAH